MGERRPMALRQLSELSNDPSFWNWSKYLQMGSRSEVRQSLCKGEDYVPNELEETDNSNYDSDRHI